MRVERHYTVEGFQGTPIHVVAAGDEKLPAIVFIHGLTHACYCWDRQLQSDLAERFQLVAYDLRGHGESGRPQSDYEKSEAWAGDLKAVIDSLGGKRVVLAGWSFGGMVICDYLRHYGDGLVRGLVFVNASTRMGVSGRENDIGEEYKALGPALCSDDMTVGSEAIGRFVNLCVKRAHAPRDFYKFLGMMAHTAPAARAGILLRHVENNDVLAGIRVPSLIVHGNDDVIILKSVAQRHAAMIAGVKTVWYDECGHCAFWEHAEVFNRDLADFVETLPQ